MRLAFAFLINSTSDHTSAPPPVPARSYGAFWMSLAIFTTLSSAGVFVATPVKGDRLMLTLWGILVRLL